MAVYDASGREKLVLDGAGGAGDGLNRISAGTQLAGTLGTIVFSNSNGVTFGMSNSSVITASVAAGGSDGFNRISAGTQLAETLGTIVFSNSNGLSFGMSGSTRITGSFDGLRSISAGTEDGNVTRLILSNANGLSFGMDAGTVTASVETNYQSPGAYLTTAMLSNAVTISNIKLSGGTSSANLSAVTFSDLNGVSFGLNGSVMTGSVVTTYQPAGAYLTTAMLSNAATISNIKLSGGTSSANLSAVTFSDLNGVSFGLDGSVMTASVVTTYQPAGAYLTTAMLSNAATISNIKVSAGTLSNNLSALTFSDSNGVSFGLSGSVVTGTVKTDYQTAGAYLTTAMLSNAATISNIKFSAGTTSNNLSALTFSDSNGVSFGLNGSVVTATVVTNYQAAGAYLTTAMLSNAATISNINLSAGTTSNNLSAFVFSNSNGISFGLNGSTVTGTVKTDYLTTAMLSNAVTISNINVSGGTTSNNLSAIVFSNSNGVSFGLNGSTMTASIGAGGAPGSISAGTTSLALGQVVFSNSNGVSFGLDGSTVTATVVTTYQPAGAYLTTAMLSNAATISNIKVSAGTLSNNLSALTFSDSNGISFGLSGSVITGTVKTDYQTAGAYLTTAMLSNAATISNIKVSAGTLSGNLSAITFSDSNNVSFGLNGSTMTAKAATSVSFYENIVGALSNQAVQQGSLYFQRQQLPFHINATRAEFIMFVSNSSSAAGTITMNFGVYTMSASTANSLFSTSQTWAYNSTMAASSYTHVSGTRYRSMVLGTWQITPGDYLVGFEMSVGTALTSGTYSHWGAAGLAIRMNEYDGGNHTGYFGHGLYTAATNGLPASLHMTQINQTGAAGVIAMPYFQLVGTQ